MAQMITPADWWRATFQAGMIAAEANAVIAMRLWGMAGFWSVPATENARMLTEKLEASSKAVILANQALLSGKSPAVAAASALGPFRSKTRANAKRLGKRGMKLVK